MATYTPNYNLEKPEASDDFKDFRQSYNGNMDIIDANLGGGGGGSASDVTYDNTDSGLSATNVQDAIDEVVTEVSGKQDALTAGDGIDITSNVISLEYLTVVNGAVNLVFDDGN